MLLVLDCISNLQFSMPSFFLAAKSMKRTMVVDQVLDVPHDFDISAVRPDREMGEVGAMFFVYDCRLGVQYERDCEKALMECHGSVPARVGHRSCGNGRHSP